MSLASCFETCTRREAASEGDVSPGMGLSSVLSSVIHGPLHPENLSVLLCEMGAVTPGLPNLMVFPNGTQHADKGKDAEDYINVAQDATNTTKSIQATFRKELEEERAVLSWVKA